MKNNYNILEKIFHKLILKNNSLQEMLFDTEQRFYVKEKNLFFDNNFFISGLARSGTTLILECFYKQEIFASLTYNDMPLICAPNLWHKISKNHKRKQKSSSRMHNDGIIFNLDSPEAFDEIIWKLLLKNKFIKEKYLDEHVLDNLVINKYQSFIKSIITKYKKKYYLNKNNNNILRLESLLNYFTNSIFIFVIREPLQHANSLQKMHELFLKNQEDDDFTLEYMNMLGHHEFGKNHKKFNFKEDLSNNIDINSLDYWLEVWINYYNHLKKFISYNNLYLIDYENFCKNPNSKIVEIIKKKEPDFKEVNFINNIRLSKKESVYNSDKLEYANNLYREILNLQLTKEIV